MKIETQPVTSSQIAEVGYDAATSTLAIKFKSGGMYHYANVSAADYAALMGHGKTKGEKHSVGSYFYRHIKPNPDKFPYTKQGEEKK